MIAETRSNTHLVTENFVPAEGFNRDAENAAPQNGSDAEVEQVSSQANSAGALASTASDLYRIGSMLLGEGEETITVIERVVASLDLDVCSDLNVARHKGRLELGADAIQVLEKHHPGALSAPDSDQSGPVSCIEDDDLDAAGVTQAELERMLHGGSDNQHLRSWLESLDLPLRVIFVLRSIAGLSAGEIATLLTSNQATTAPSQQTEQSSRSWSEDAVRGGFRQALCSLASQLLHASVTK